MLILSRKNTASIRVPLGGGAALHARKATSLDFEPALAEATRIVGSLRESHDALEAFGLPISFDDVEIGEERLKGLFELIVNVELAMRVVSSVEGVLVDDAPTSEPSRELFALLFLDVGAARTFRAAALADLHERTVVGNGSAPSLTGEGAAEQPIARDVGGSEPPAPVADVATTAAAAPNTITAS